MGSLVAKVGVDFSTEKTDENVIFFFLTDFLYIYKSIRILMDTHIYTHLHSSQINSNSQVRFPLFFR